MIELENSLKGMMDGNVVAVSFPEVHPNAILLVDFHRTLRTPEDGRIHRCPHTGNGLALCDAKHLTNWNKPNCFFHRLLQSEAVRIRFCSPNGYSFAVRIIVNGRCAITGNPVAEEDPSGFLPDSEVQNYLAVTDRTILDGCLDAEGMFHQIIPRMLGDSVTLGKPKDYLSDSTHINIQVVPLRGDAEAAVAKRPLVFNIWESVNLSEPAFDNAGSARAGSPQFAVRSDSLSLDEYDFSACETFALFLLNTHEWSDLEGKKPWIKPMPVDYFDTLGNHWSYGYSEWGFESQSLPLSRPPVPVSGNDTLVILRDSYDHIAVTRQLLAELHPEDVIFYRNSGRMGEESTYRFGLEDGTLLFTDDGWDGSYKTECSDEDMLSWMPKSCKDQTEDFYLGFGMAINARKDWLTTPLGRVLYQQVLKSDKPNKVRPMDVYFDLAQRYTRCKKLLDQCSDFRKITLDFL